MTNVYKIAFDINSDVVGDSKVHYYIFDAIILTDGSNTQVVKTEFNPTKIDLAPVYTKPTFTSEDSNVHNGQKLVKYTFPNESDELHEDDSFYLPFTDKSQTINLNLEKLKLKALMYEGNIIKNITLGDSSDNKHRVFNDTIVLEFGLKAPINNTRQYHFDWIEDQGWTIDNSLFNESATRSRKLLGSPLQLIPYNKDTGLILKATEQYNPTVGNYDSTIIGDPSNSQTWDLKYVLKPTPIYPRDVNNDEKQTTNITVLDEWLSPQDPKEVVTKDQMGYVLAPLDVSVPDNVSDLIANVNKDYTHTFYWDPRPAYDPDKYDKRSLVTDGIIYPLNDKFYINFLNSPYFSIPLDGVTFHDQNDREKHENDTIDIEILLNNVVISTQTVTVSNPVLQPIDSMTFNKNHDVAEKATIDLQTNSLYYSIERSKYVFPGGWDYLNEDGFQIVCNPYPSELSGYRTNEKTLEKTVPVVGSYVAVNNIAKNIPVLSIQSIDFITGDIILSNNSTRKLTD